MYSITMYFFCGNICPLLSAVLIPPCNENKQSRYQPSGYLVGPEKENSNKASMKWDEQSAGTVDEQSVRTVDEQSAGTVDEYSAGIVYNRTCMAGTADRKWKGCSDSH